MTIGSLWIVHRHSPLRAALARIAAAERAVLGGPSDRHFETDARPGAILLGLSGDFEQELEFAYRASARLEGCPWIVVAPPADLPEARRLFDALPAKFVAYPPEPATLQPMVSSILNRRGVDPLSSRRGRDATADRFARWLGSVPLPDLMRALDPKLGSLPLLVRGEPGTGRGLVCRYVHEQARSVDAPFIHVACEGVTKASDLLEQIRDGGATHPTSAAPTVWLEDVDRLPPPLQRHVRDWILNGLPPGTLSQTNAHFMASAGDDRRPDTARLEAGLAGALASGPCVRVPTLREVPASIEAFVADAALVASRSQGGPLRRFDDSALRALEAHPWPGNRSELEAVVRASLSASVRDPLGVDDLVFPGLPADAVILEREPTVTTAEPWSAGGLAEEQLAPREAPVPTPSTHADRLEAALLAGDDALGHAGAEDEDEIEDWEDETEAEDELAEAEILEMLGPVDAGRSAALADFDDEPDADDLPRPSPLPAREEEPAAGLTLVEDSAQTSPDDAREPSWRRLVRSLAHEVRNPLVSIRTFSELLPQHFGDEEFRERFVDLVGRDVRRIDSIVTRLQHLGDLDRTKLEPVDLSSLLEGLVDERRPGIQARRLLVLRELERDRPTVVAEPLSLREALAGLLDKALDIVPDQGDLFLATRYHPDGLAGRPSVRLLLRHHNPNAASGTPGGIVIEDLSHSELALEYVLAEITIRSQGGVLTVDSTDVQETCVIVDLPAPASA